MGSAGRTVMRVEEFETRPPLTQAEENEDLPFDVPIIPYHVATPEDPAPRQSVEWVGEDEVEIQVRALPHTGVATLCHGFRRMGGLSQQHAS